MANKHQQNCNCKDPLDLCQPCSHDDTPEPVMPKCYDVDLTDGTYENATVVIEDGCIVRVEAGRPFQYTPEPCSQSGGSGNNSTSGQRGPRGRDGRDGDSATITIGEVTTLPAGSNARVTNDGTDTHAVLSFSIPKGDKGKDADSANGIDDDTWFDIKNGVIMDLPVDYPPVSVIQAESDDGDIALSAEKDEESGAIKLTLNVQQFKDSFKSEIERMVNEQIDNLNNRVEDLENS